MIAPLVVGAMTAVLYALVTTSNSMAKVSNTRDAINLQHNTTTSHSGSNNTYNVNGGTKNTRSGRASIVLSTIAIFILSAGLTYGLMVYRQRIGDDGSAVTSTTHHDIDAYNLPKPVVDSTIFEAADDRISFVANDGGGCKSVLDEMMKFADTSGSVPF